MVDYKAKVPPPLFLFWSNALLNATLVNALFMIHRCFLSAVKVSILLGQDTETRFFKILTKNLLAGYTVHPQKSKFTNFFQTRHVISRITALKRGLCVLILMHFYA